MFERNAIARMLISGHEVAYFTSNIDGSVSKQVLHRSNDVSKLVVFKIFGLLVAIEILEWLAIKDTKSSRAIIYTITLVQATLLYYLVT